MLERAKLTREEVQRLEVERQESQRSPYSRFRARRKRLTVSDLVSPAWCEVQFQYELEKGGRKRRTKAMKAGHEMHSTLEKEVHAVVDFAIDADIPEERFGLRLLNMISGIAELQRGKLTREFPVFGILDGTLVSGIIDQIKSQCDSDLTNEQKAMAEFLGTSSQFKRNEVLVLSDHKTRVSKTEPSQSQVDQTRLQIMLYARLLKELPSLELQEILAIEELSAARPFSDDFLAQSLNMLEHNLDLTAADIIENNSIRGLWHLLQPRLVGVQDLLSPKMSIHYIHQASGESIATKDFDMDQMWMDKHLYSILEWWNGNRDPDGVPIEESFKCRICQFEEGCSWRLNKVREGIERKRKQKTLLP